MLEHKKITISIELDGDQYCALLGVNLQEGIAGFGGTVQESIDEFCEAWGNANIFQQKNAIESLSPSPRVR